MHSKAWRVFLIVGVSALLVTGCGGDDDDGDGGGSTAPFELVVSPEFVQGMVPGEPIPLLVTVTGAPEDGAVALAADFAAGTTSIEPESIEPGRIAEVTFVADSVTEDVEAQLTITATRGPVEQTASRQATVVPVEDDRGEMAHQLLALFTEWLAENHPDLGITRDTEFASAMVAPRLLIVSHYLFLNDEYEVGLSWHVTVPPDDWSEIYLRPRDEMSPTFAYRLSSWTTALEGGAFEFSEATVPQEVVR